MKVFGKRFYQEVERDWSKIDTAIAEYNQLLRSVPLPKSLSPLKHPFHLDDALVSRARVDQRNGTVKLVLRCGNIPDGYFDLELEYSGVTMSARDVSVLKQIAGTTLTSRCYESDNYVHELLADANGEIRHGFLFHPGITFEIRCHQLRWKRFNRSSRRLAPYKQRYQFVGSS